MQEGNALQEKEPSKNKMDKSVWHTINLLVLDFLMPTSSSKPCLEKHLNSDGKEFCLIFN